MGSCGRSFKTAGYSQVAYRAATGVQLRAGTYPAGIISLVTPYVGVGAQVAVSPDGRRLCIIGNSGPTKHNPDSSRWPTEPEQAAALPSDQLPIKPRLASDPQKSGPSQDVPPRGRPDSGMSGCCADCRPSVLLAQPVPLIGRSVEAGRQVQAVADRKQAGMSLFQRAHDIVRAKANKALDGAERPDEMLDLSYEDMLDQITNVKQALVSITASRKHIELQEQQLQHTVEHLDDAARAALAQGKEDLAREALNRKAAAQQQIAGFDAQRDELNEQQQKMEQALSALQGRVNKFRSQKEVLKAQYQAARAQTAVSETATGISGSFGDTGTELQRSMDKIEAMQARAGAMDELLQSGVLEDVGGKTVDIEQELEEAGRNAQVDKELAAMRAEIANSSETPQLPARDD
jgi:phage shock protein A